MLFVASPLSINSFRLMVIVLFKRGGSFDIGGFAVVLDEASPGAGKTVFCEGVGAADDPGAESDSVAGFDCKVPLGAAAGRGSSGPIAGGSDGSAPTSCAARATITVSPASLATPPASAKTSRRVTGRPAWYTMGCKTAPTTVMGLLFLSLTLRLTSGWDTS